MAFKLCIEAYMTNLLFTLWVVCKYVAMKDFIESHNVYMTYSISGCKAAAFVGMRRNVGAYAEVVQITYGGINTRWVQVQLSAGNNR